MEDELKELLQQTGDGIADVFTQMQKGNWIDDHGHDVRMNAAMQNMKTVLVAIMQFRTKHLDYTETEHGMG